MKAIRKLLSRIFCPKPTVWVFGLGDKINVYGTEMEVCEISYEIDKIHGDSARLKLRQRPKIPDFLRESNAK